MLETTKERIQRELRGEPTGFDILVEQRRDNLVKLHDLMEKNPELTREDASRLLGVCKRTVTRYLADLRRVYKKKYVMTTIDIAVEGKKKRMGRLKHLIKVHPEYSRERLRKELGISKRTLYIYLAELEMV